MKCPRFAIALVAPVFCHALLADDSPFERQMKATLAQWAEPTPQSLALARERDRPVFFFVGHFGNSLSRAMATETFSNQTIADVLNETTVPVLVDAAESPELAAFIRQLAEDHFKANDWPICLWTTSELAPIGGGGYFPPTDDWGGQGFLSLERNVAERWAANKSEAVESADARLKSSLATKAPLSSDAFSQAIARATEPRTDTVSLEAAEMLALAGLGAENRSFVSSVIAQSSQRAGFDSVAGGFFIGANDPEWRIPLFQKSTSDQALMLETLATVYRDEPKPELRDLARLTQLYIETSLLNERGLAIRYIDSFMKGDAPDALEGGHYLIDAAGVASLDETTIQLWSLSPDGNVDPNADILGLYTGLNIPYPASLETLAAKTDAARAPLLALRAAKAPLQRDEIASTAVNAQIVSGLAAVSQSMSDDSALVRAKSIFDAISAHCVSAAGHLASDDKGAAPASSFDFAYLIAAALDLHQATGDDAYLQRALKLEQEWTANPRFSKSQPYALPLLGTEISYIVVRDNDVPSVAATQIRNLRRLTQQTGDNSFQAKADALLAVTQGSEDPLRGSFLSLLALRKSP